MEEELKNEFGDNNYNVDDSDSNNWILTGNVQEKEQSITIPAGEIVDTTWQKAFEFPQNDFTRYTLDEGTKTITLLQYGPRLEGDIEIKSYAIIEGKKYNTKFQDSILNMFTGSMGLTSVKITDKIDTTNITSLSGLFAGDSELTSIDLSGLNTSNVTDMSRMFNACYKLKKVNLSGLNTSKVNNMSDMFNTCKVLTNVDLSKINTSNVTNMSRLFNNCFELENIDLSEFNTSSVTNMSYMFNDCSMLKYIYASDNFIINNSALSEDMFQRCSSLKGGNGTEYDSSKTDATMAHIDTAVYENGTLVNGTSGYFTAK